MKAFLLLLLLLPQPHAQANESVEEIQKELQGFHEQMEGVMKQMERLANVAPASSDSLDQTRRKAIRLASDDRFLQAARDLWDHPGRNNMLLFQLGFFVLMTLLRAWRQSRCAHWFKRLLVGFLFSILTWAGLLYGIPLLVLGEPFAVFTSTLWRVLVLS